MTGDLFAAAAEIEESVISESDQVTAISSDSSGTAKTESTCCVVGGGPAGAVLSLLLARKGIPVMLLEAHKDFDRVFRGDTLHPSTMELMDGLGLADSLLELPHTRLEKAGIQTPSEHIVFADFSRLATRFPFIVLMPQSRFLEFVTSEASRFSNFTLRMGASAQELIREDGVCVGVRYRTSDGRDECRAALTVACDGRFSRLRKLTRLEQVKTSPPMDVLWFRLPRKPEDGLDLMFRVNEGHLVVMLDRGDFWQLGYVILKGEFHDIRERGLDRFRVSLGRLVPELSDRVGQLTEWTQLTPLNVEAGRLRKWYSPGLLFFIGDAAHVMSPVDGVGINYAIQDAVEAANVLGEPLQGDAVTTEHLSLVQRKREFPTRVIQWFQGVIQQQFVKASLNPEKPFRPPWFLRIPLIRTLPARLVAFGIRRARLRV